MTAARVILELLVDYERIMRMFGLFHCFFFSFFLSFSDLIRGKVDVR